MVVLPEPGCGWLRRCLGFLARLPGQVGLGSVLGSTQGYKEALLLRQRGRMGSSFWEPNQAEHAGQMGPLPSLCRRAEPLAGLPAHMQAGHRS